MFKKIFYLSNILCTAYILLFIYLISNINFQLSILDPIDGALKDFELTDIIHSQFRHSKHDVDESIKVGDLSADTNIVIVNIGMLGRDSIAREIAIISQYEPKVIGIDAFFRHPKNEDSDSLLSRVLQAVPNVVLVSKLHYNEKIDDFDSLELSNPIFSNYTQNGFANLITKKGALVKTCRTFNPLSHHINQKDTAFPVKLASYIDKKKVSKFLERKNDVEIINYRGNIDKYHVINIQDLFSRNFDPSIIKNKIVLMGMVGTPNGNPSWEDMFYSPLNENYAGKAYPDIYGIVVHANIISMIINEEYINTMTDWWGIILGILICHLNVVVFRYILHEFAIWYGAITKGLQLLQSVVLIVIVLYVYDKKAFSIDSGLSFACIALGGDLIELWFDGIMHIKVSKYLKKVFIMNINKFKNSTNIKHNNEN